MIANPARRVLLLAVFMLLSGLAPGAMAAPPSDADRQQFQSLIGDQIAAFRRDDFSAAFGMASPAIQGLFMNPDGFSRMVKGAFQPVYRPRSVTFGPALDSPTGPLQRVFLVGPDGKAWVAEYTMQRQPDGTWRINGCRLLEDNGASI
jgi:hypothetical protein